jgi:hypothetical protein
MDSSIASLMGLMTLLEGALQLGVALLPLAIWQRTRQRGFLLVAAGFGLGAVLQLVSLLLFRVGGTSSIEMLAAWRLVGFVAMVLIATGFWQVYAATRATRAPAAPAPQG